MPVLLSVSFFYLITGSAGFLRKKIDPNTEKPEFDYCFRVMFRAGIVLFALGVVEWFLPSPYWGIALVVILMAMFRSIWKKVHSVLFNHK